MWLACNAPASMWDEFCATVVYLANFTTSSSAKHVTPHELWYGKVPSLSHLHEIRCQAFSLIQTHNPKIYQRSMPCTLIGYAPHSKAYCLWDNTTGMIFNSFHVTFIKHLNSLPLKLLPGTTLDLDTDAPLSWDTPSPDQASLKSHHPPAPSSIPSPAPLFPVYLPPDPYSSQASPDSLQSSPDLPH